MPRAAVAGAYPAAVLADGPSAYWRLGEAAGSAIVADQLGKTPGIVTGDITLGAAGILPGDTGLSASFAGATGQINMGTGLAQPGSWSVEAWAMIPNADGGVRTLVTRRDAAGGGNLINFDLVRTASNMGLYCGDGAASFNINSPTADNDGIWHYWVGTWDGVSLRLYKDGKLVAGPTVPTNLPVSTGNQAMTIGYQPGPANIFKGGLQEVAVYPFALSAARVQQRYLSGLTSGLRPAVSYPGMILGDSPAAYWRLNDAGIVVADQLGTNPGSLPFPGGVTRGVAGALSDGDAAMTFDGSSGYVAAATMAALQGTATRTVEMWVKSSNSTSALEFFDSGGTTVGVGFLLAVTKQGSITWGGSPGGNVPGLYISGGAGNDVYLPGLAADGLWHHVVVIVSNAGTLVRAYVDGAQPSGYIWNSATWSGLLGQPFTAPTPFNTTANPVWLGQGRLVSAGWSQFFSGSIDEAAVYPSVLTSAQALRHYQSGARAMPRVGVDYRAVVLSDSPVAYWRLDDSGAQALDSAGSYPGVIGAGVTKGVAGALIDGNAAMTFDGATGAIIPPTPPITPAFSIETWLKSNGSLGTVDVLSRRAVGGANELSYEFVLIGHQVNLFVGITGAVTPAPVDDDSRWHHFVGTYDGTSIRLYRDGVLVAGPTAATPTSGGTMTLNIGRDASLGRNWNGTLDEIAIYPSALTSAQVLRHYQTALRGKASRVSASYANVIKADNPVAYWRLDDVGASAVDAIAGNNGTIGAGITKGAPGPIADGNGAMIFPGTVPGEVTFSDFAAIDFGDVISIECWVKAQAGLSAFARVLNKQNGGVGLGWVISENNNLATLAYRVDTPGANNQLYLGSKSVFDGAWHHVVCVLNNGNRKAYVDGAIDPLAGGQATYIPGGGFASTQPLEMGGGAAAPLNGALDEVAIFHYELSAQQVLDHYTAGTALRRATAP